MKAPIAELDKDALGHQNAVYIGHSFPRVLGVSFIEVNHQETMYLSYIISTLSRNAITQVRVNIVPSAHGRKHSHLLHHVVEDIYMKKVSVFCNTELKTLLSVSYKVASIKSFSVVLMPRGKIFCLACFFFDKVRTISCSIPPHFFPELQAKLNSVLRGSY